MKKINLSETEQIYRFTFENYSKCAVVEECLVNSDISNPPKLPRENTPGFQSDVQIINGKLEELVKEINKLVISNIYKDSTGKYGFRNWIYISDSSNNYSFYHRHTSMKQLHCEGEWTWTFYVQMPNNLEHDDGKLSFKLKDGKVKNFLPEEGNLFIFPATLDHMPLLNKKSTKDRIVIGGTLSKLDMNHRYEKGTKTLL